MNKTLLAFLSIVATAVVMAPLTGRGQSAQRPTSEQGQKANEDPSAWVGAFNALTGKQRAEVVRRHVNRSLTTLTLTESQRTLIADYLAKFVTEENYSTTDPAKREALASEMKPAMEKAKTMLGDEIFIAIFINRPPLSDIEAVRNDPAFR